MNQRIDDLLRKRQELVVGAFLGAGFLGLVFVFIWTLWSMGSFTKTYTLNCVFRAQQAQELAKDSTESPVMGINQGTSVLINGVTVGKVDSVILETNGDVRIKLEIQKRYQEHITSNSVATPIRERNVISDRVINIIHGNGGTMLADGQLLRAEPSRDIEGFISQARLLLQEVENLVHLGDTLIRMTGNPKNTIGALIASDAVYKKLDKNLDLLTKISEGGLLTLQNVNQNAPEIMRNALQLSRELQTISKQSQSTLGQASLLLNKGDTLITQGNQIAKGTAPLLHQIDSLLRQSGYTLKKVDTTLNKSGHVLDSLSVPWLLFRGRKD